MARFYTDENFAQRVIRAVRDLGHDVLTALDAGQANDAVSGAGDLSGKLLRVVRPSTAL